MDFSGMNKKRNNREKKILCVFFETPTDEKNKLVFLNIKTNDTKPV